MSTADLTDNDKDAIRDIYRFHKQRNGGWPDQLQYFDNGKRYAVDLEGNQLRVWFIDEDGDKVDDIVLTTPVI